MYGWSMFFYIAVNLAIHICAYSYTGWRLFGCVKYLFAKKQYKANGKIFAVVYGAMLVPMVLEFMPLPLTAPYAVRVIGGYWMGIYFYLFVFTVLAEGAIALARAFKKFADKEALKKARFYAGAAAVVLAVAVAGYGFFNAARVVFAEYYVELKRPLAGEPLNIVFISDLHLGSVGSERQLPRIIEGINSKNPDLVAIIGDIFNDDFYAVRDPARAEALFREIYAPLGVFAVLGNHDAGPTLGSMLSFLERGNVRVLKDEYVIIDGRFVLLGRLDPTPFGRLPDEFAGWARGELADIKDFSGSTLPIVVLDHHPRSIREGADGADLVLMGHTHRGQVFPAGIVTSMLFGTDHGHLQRDGTHFIVTQGVHTVLMPIRVGTNNEIARVVIR